jgi:hypothetical protein
LWNKRNLCTLLVGMQANATSLEKNLETSWKSKHKSAIWSSNTTPGDIPKGMWHRLLQRHLRTHVYYSTIHNSQVMETTTMPQYWWMDQENVIFIHKERMFDVYIVGGQAETKCKRKMMTVIMMTSHFSKQGRHGDMHQCSQLHCRWR